MAYHAVELVNRALVKIGASPIQDLTDAKAEAQIANLLYETTLDGLLSSHPWSFATAQKPLLRLMGKPIADYTYAYQLPNDFLRALSVGAGEKGAGQNYRILEKRLHCDQSAVNLTYIYRPKEINFPAFFSQVFIARLSAEFCLPIVESVSRTESLMRHANEELKKARLIDSQQETPKIINDYSLITARMS